MKNLYAILLLFTVVAYGQDVAPSTNPDNININVEGTGYTLELAKDGLVKVSTDTIKSFTINHTLTTGFKLKIECADFSRDYLHTDGNKTIKVGDDFLSDEISLQLIDNNNQEVAGKRWAFRVRKGDKNDDKKKEKAESFDEFIKANALTFEFTNLIKTPFGFVDENQYIHIFIDYRGNNIGSTTPQGIANAQYVVHVLSPASDDPTAPVYTIRQTSGSFSDALNFRNSNAKDVELHNSSSNGSINDRQFLLSTSTTNISFELVAVTEAGNTFQRTTIETYTIKMTPTYHGSFDVGFVNSELASPTYTLVNTPDGAAQTVKVTDNGKSQGVTTLMATFYYSPIIILEDLLYKWSNNKSNKKQIPFYKLNGRNFLDDHEIYERIYPTVGVGLKDKVFENVYFGFNWEIVRGLGLFYGWNYRKVNTFNMPGFEEGISTVTQDQFDYYTNTDWKIKPAYGVKLDLLVVLGLLGTK